MMIKDGSKRLVVVVVGISVISYEKYTSSSPAAHQELHPARIKNERSCAFFGLFWDVLKHNGDVG